MPAKRRTAGRWQFMRPCASPGCERPTAVRVMGAPGEIVYICEEHTLRSFAALGRLRGHTGRCVSCNPKDSSSPRAFFVDVLDWEGELCAAHTLAFLAVALAPHEFKRMAQEAGDPARVQLLGSEHYEWKSGVSHNALLDERDIPVLAQYRTGGITPSSAMAATSGTRTPNGLRRISNGIGAGVPASRGSGEATRH